MKLIPFRRPETSMFKYPQAVLAPPSIMHRVSRYLPFSAQEKAIEPPSSPTVFRFNLLELDVLDGDELSFTISTSGIQLLYTDPDHDILQRQMVRLLSPFLLITADMLITINTTSQKVMNLQVLQLSSWAEGELGSWLSAIHDDFHVTCVGAAFRHYIRTCLERLKCWINVAKNFSDLLPVDSDLHKLSSAGLENDLTQFVPFLGWQTCSLTRDSVALDISWHVSISEDGEVGRDVSVRSAFPRTWQRNEMSTGLAKVGEAFDILKVERGVFEAISVVAKLMFPTKDVNAQNSQEGSCSV